MESAKDYGDVDAMRLQSKSLKGESHEGEGRREQISVNPAVSRLKKLRTPTILAVKRGDASAIRFIITAALILVSHYASD
jgi:hypothetical protein